MTKYIDKAELYGQIAELEEYTRNTLSQLTRANPLFSEYHVRLLERGYLKHLVADFPTADVAPVVHGRWETNADAEEEIKDFTCSVCEYQLCDIDTSVIMPGENDFYFCPNCGAKMDLEE